MKTKKLKNGDYSAVISLGFDENGKRLQKRITAKTISEVHRIASELLSQKGDLKIQALTVKEAMQQYVDSHSELLEATTLRNYHEIIRNRLVNIHNIPIKELKIVDIQIAVNIEASKGLARRTIKNGVDLLKTTLEFYDVNLNFKKVQLPKDKPKPKNDLPNIAKVFSALKESPIETYCLLAFHGCMRIGEVLGLKFSDVDFEKHILHIHRTQTVTEEGIVYRDYCKTPQSIRDVEISAELCEAVRRLKHTSDDEYIVPMTRKALYSRYARIMKSKGLPTSFHLLRKMSASALHAYGMPDKYILYLGGWSTDNVLKSVYEGTFERERKKANQQAIACFKKINEQVNESFAKASNELSGVTKV